MSGPRNDLARPRSAQGALAAHRRREAIPDRGRGWLPGTPLAGAPRRLFIGGAWRQAADGRTLAVEDPANGEAICRVAATSSRTVVLGP